jgi:RNA polymerase sigma factor (sigma-70 family)
MSDFEGGTTVRLRSCLQRLANHDETSRDELLEHARQRLTVLAERMFFRCPALHFREAAEDLFQQAMLRLWQALDRVQPSTVPEFMGLAAHEMRWALGDLARRHFGRNAETEGGNAKRPVISADFGRNLSLEPDSSTWAPDELACWSEFHAAADRLAEPARTAFDLLYYHELSQTEVAKILNISERQVRRYWQSAREDLHRMLAEWLPSV